MYLLTSPESRKFDRSVSFSLYLLIDNLIKFIDKFSYQNYDMIYKIIFKIIKQRFTLFIFIYEKLYYAFVSSSFEEPSISRQNFPPKENRIQN